MDAPDTRSMSKIKTLSVLVPAYNEERTIGPMLEKVVSITRDERFRILAENLEIVVVDDGSKDGTADIVRNLISNCDSCRIVLASQPNGGKGTAIRKAISMACGDVMVVQDADLEYDPDDFMVMLPFIVSGEYEVVYGSRFLNHQNKHSYSSFYLGGRLVSLTANILYGLNLTDEPTCYKMFTREVADSITLKCKGFEFCPEFTAKVTKAGYKIQEVPIHYYPRSIEEGKKINWKDGVEAVWTLLKYRFVK